MIKTYCGVDCCSECPRLPECGGCEICQGHPFGEYGCNGAAPEIALYKRREDSYVCRIASLEEVNERWDTLIREHPEDPNWAVWKTDVLAEVSAGKEIPYYGFLGGEIICEAYAIPNYTPGEDDKGYREDGTAYLSAFRTVKAYRGRAFFRNFFTSCLMTSERRALQEPFWESSRMRCSTSRCIFIGALPRKCTQEPAPTRTARRLRWNTL